MTALGEGTEQLVDRVREGWRNSLAVKLVAALLAVLVVSTVATYVFSSRLTRARLNEQAIRVLQDDLDALSTRVLEQQTKLGTSLRNAAHSLSLETADPGMRESGLLLRLSDLDRTLQLDTLAAVGEGGRTLAVVGTPLAALPGPQPGETFTGTTHLVRTIDERHLLASLVTFRFGDEQAVLIGGVLFDDAEAYRMRRLTGSDVLLVADGRLVGTTLTEPVGSPPLVAGSQIPEEPGVVRLAGRPTFVQYRTVATQDESWNATAVVGAALPEPVASLGRSLERTRLVTMAGLVLLAGGLGWVLVRRLSRPVLDLVETAGRIRTGDLDSHFEVRSEDEVGLLAATLEGMRQSIKRQIAIIRRQSRDLREAAERLVGAQTEERRRLARDLHDGAQSRLVLLRMHLGVLRNDLRDGDVTEESIDALAREADEAIEDLRAFSQAVYPAILEDRGLTGAVNSLAGRSPVPVHVRFEPDPLPRLPDAVEASAYFIVSEAMTNAWKHADPDHIDVTVRLEDDTLHVRVVDDGRGFRSGDGRASIPHLEDRARVFGGRCEVMSASGEGTTVAASIPARVRTETDASDDRVAETTYEPRRWR